MTYGLQHVSHEYKHWITDHALHRFRERAEPEIRALDEKAAGRVLDDRLAHATVTEVVDADKPEEPTVVALIENRDGKKLFVVLRDYRASTYPRTGDIVGGPGRPGKIAITVLTSEMGQDNFIRGRWRALSREVARVVEEQRRQEDVVEGDRKERLRVVAAVAPVPSAPLPERAAPQAGASTAVRYAFVRQVLRQRPSIGHGGDDGMVAILRAEFGVGIAFETYCQLRDEVRSEAAARERPIAPPPMPHQVASQISRIHEPSIAERLGDAIAREKAAKAAVAAARDVLSRADESAVAAGVEVERLLGELAAARG